MARLARFAQQAALAAFGEPAQLTIDGRAVALVGIFHAAHETMELVQDAPVSSVRPALAVRAADLPEPPMEGDRVEVAGRRFRVVDAQPDGFGMTKLVLQEA